MERPISNFQLGMKGFLEVNLPVFIIIFGMLFLLLSFTSIGFEFSLLIGVALAWIYWSHAVKKWIEWAVANNVSEERILTVGKQTLLVWNKNTIESVTKGKKKPWI